MVSVSNISVQFGGDPLFDHVSFIINDKDRIGLVGKNGAGKTTLLKILKGLLPAGEGEVVMPDSQTIGYLPQEMETSSRQTVLEEASMAFSEVIELETRIKLLEQEIHLRTDFESKEYHALLKQQSEVYERFHIIGGSSIHADVERVLTGLGFSREDFIRSMSEFSSGWQMRVEIAKILLRQPDLILLDEPTNHLDIEAIQWLETFLVQYRGAVILVSHDRAFLDNVCTRTIEITMGKIYDYKANYSGYVEMREERMESQLATYENQQRQIRQVERFIERFRYKNTKSKQVQSRIRMLEKMDVVEVESTDESSIHFRFPPAPHSGKIVLEGRNIIKDYPQKRVLHGIDFTVVKGDRIAFVGRNGEGKTTLSKIITGILEYSGELKKGHNVVTGYYAQDQSEHLNPELTVFQTIDEIAVGDIRPRLKGILGGFLFSGDDIEKKVKVLSGGERSRLSIAKLLLTPANLLVLDEPTNHLDMRSKDILKSALLRYNGTLIIVSHDRDFLQGLTSRVFEFREGKFREHIGDIYDYLEQRKIRELTELEKSSSKEKDISREAISENKATYEKKKESERDLRKVKNQIGRSENEIENLENAVKILEGMLGEPQKHQDRIRDGSLYREYEDLKSRLLAEMNKWEDLHSELEKFS
ncbi:MAG: ATP-binding cassette domain-containing protein [Bacteroidetes bacterium]|nr:ATP-binding cassette domain-containing protein [Bacteroidota bacterium]